MVSIDELEKEVRDIIVNDLMVSHAEFIELEDELSLDSLTQTELRVTLQQRYGLDPSPEAMPVTVTATLASLLEHMKAKVKVN